jgi:hypothetical protein
VSPYEVLGVSPTATPAEIRRAYLTLARRHHPDAGGDAAQMRRLNEAWAALSTTPNPSPTSTPGPAPASDVDPHDETSQNPWDADLEHDDEVVAVAASPRARLLDNLTLLALLATVVAAALSLLFGMLFESGPLLGFCVYSLFMAGVLVVARTLLAMGHDRSHVR